MTPGLDRIEQRAENRLAPLQECDMGDDGGPCIDCRNDRALAEDVLALVAVARAAQEFYDDEPVNGVEAVEALRLALAHLDGDGQPA